jgi:hypothetical protein
MILAGVGVGGTPVGVGCTVKVGVGTAGVGEGRRTVGVGGGGGVVGFGLGMQATIRAATKARRTTNRILFIFLPPVWTAEAQLLLLGCKGSASAGESRAFGLESWP